jgi:hypothetical protein
MMWKKACLILVRAKSTLLDYYPPDRIGPVAPRAIWTRKLSTNVNSNNRTVQLMNKFQQTFRETSSSWSNQLSACIARELQSGDRNLFARAHKPPPEHIDLNLELELAPHNIVQYEQLG